MSRDLSTVNNYKRIPTFLQKKNDCNLSHINKKEFKNVSL